MNPHKLRQLLSELTPAIRAYLFPGMTVADSLFEEAGEEVYTSAAPVFYDMIEEEAALAPAPAAAEPEMKLVRKKPQGIFGRASRMEKASAPEPEGTIPEEECLDPRTGLILSEIRRLQEKYDVSIDELEILLGYTVQLSQLHILRSGKIYLSAYDNTEVKMPNVAKTLYFLYLRHPEGLRFKEVAYYRDELVHIYSNITGRDEPEEIEKSIDLLVDPFSNALNVNASRIKTAFRNAVSDRIARFYYINGAAGDVKKVPLDRDLVIWEC